MIKLTDEKMEKNGKQYFGHMGYGLEWEQGLQVGSFQQRSKDGAESVLFQKNSKKGQTFTT